MTELEAIKKAILLTYQQGKVSISEETHNCKYRNDDNCKCTVGHLIDDEFYSKELEQRSIACEKVTDALEKSLGFELKTDLIVELRDLQITHDTMGIGLTEIQFREKYIKELSIMEDLPLIAQALKELKAEKKIK